MINEGVVSESTIVGVIVLYLDVALLGERFECQFSFYYTVTVISLMKVNIGQVGVMILEHGGVLVSSLS